ncbi:MBL fold metallo-hydrolase [Herbiconiux sp. A18JL235]|uniref:MBL fold metallo-hydrolase n=1 Tax=Herbiconiux sp. A18JL235 TaxID=3152363 RepID=A0AB39BJL4_9MICO
MRSGHGDWEQVGAGVFRRRFEPLDVSIGVVVAAGGLTVIDTRNNPAEARELVADVGARFEAPIVAVVNTHAHYDHSFGNQHLASLDGRPPIYGHAMIARHYADHEAPRLEAVQRDPQREPDKSWGEVMLTPPTVEVERAVTIEPGGRPVRLQPLPRGHTDTDLAVLVPDSRVWFVGDVIEESGPPMFGSGSFPLEWPAALDALLALIEPGDVIVPGHGAVVDRDFVVRQRDAFGEMAAFIRSSRAAGLDVEAAAAAAPAPLAALWPSSFVASALRAGFAALG